MKNLCLEIGITQDELNCKCQNKKYLAEIDFSSVLFFKVNTGGISDAPVDDKMYARKNEKWEEITTSGGEATLYWRV